MICSFSRRFLFIKTRKTAGTSVEIALSNYCGGDDIITPISPEDELLRLGHGRLPQNYSRYRLHETALRAAVRLRSQRLMRALIRWEAPRRAFYNHMTLEEVRALVPQAKLAPLKSFTIERHPYEKVISLAYFLRNSRKHRGQELPAVVDAVIESKRYLNYPQYTVGGAIAVDRVLRQETLMADLNGLLRELDLPAIADLPRAKGGFRGSRAPAAEELTAAQKHRIHADARFEFDHLGYEP